jgi:phosphate transport system permease protein
VVVDVPLTRAPAAAAATRRPRRPGWVPALAGTGGAGLLLAALLVVGFLLAGLRAGPVDWPGLIATATWDAATGRYGAAAMIFGTVVVCGVALALAVPVSWAAAVALSEQLRGPLAACLRSGVELLAVIPSIVYGLVGIAVLRPVVAHATGVSGGDSLLAAGLVLAVMVTPTIVAVSVDALAAVPPGVRETASALGLTRSEVVRSAVLPYARPGMRAAVLLGLARAMGETIAVFLVIGRADGQLPRSPAEALDALTHAGQTLTTKLGGPEPVLAGAVGPHRAALCAVGLVLLAAVAAATFAGARPHPAGRAGRRGPWGVRRAQRWRGPRDRAARALRVAAVLLPCTLLAGVVALLVVRGHDGLAPGFWLSDSSGSSGGGVRRQILGTLLLVAATAAISLPLGLGAGLLLGEYAGRRTSRLLRSGTLVLGGVPTILLGLAGFAVFCTAFAWGKSWLAGALVLAPVVVPVVTLATAARADALPAEQRETAEALGLSRGQVVRSLLIPYVRPAALTALLLGLARAAGETAPLLFTATVFSGADALPHGVVQSPVQALPTHVFVLAQDAADPAAVTAAWASALVLVVLSGLLLLGASPLRRRVEAGR